VVLFFDSDGWNCFLQLAAALRRAGARPVCVQIEGGGWRRRAIGRLGYGTVLCASSGRDLRRLERWVDAGQVADVHLNELNLARLDGASRCAGLLRRAAGERWRLTDKLEVSGRLAAAGVAVPSFGGVGAGDAEALGYPLMVKERLSSGGAGVLAVGDRGSLDGVIARLSAQTGVGCPSPSVFAERRIEGEVVQYAALVGPAGVEQEVCLLVRKAAADPLGPSVSVVTTVDPVLRAAGRKAVAALGCSGLVNLEFVRDREGRVWHIDLSARAYGNLAALECAGIEMIGGYLRLLGLGAAPGGAAGCAPGTRLDVFPATFLARKRLVGLGRAARGLAGEARPYQRRFGVRYLLAIALVVVDAWFRARPAAGGAATGRVAMRSVRSAVGRQPGPGPLRP
jgi:hypothetical protein